MTSALAYYSLTSIAHSENDSMSAWGIFVHSVVRSSSKRNAVWMLAVYGILLRWSMSHTCSIGLRSGDCDGHGNTSVPLSITQFVTIRATRGRALSWMGWKFWPTAPANGSSIGRRILSMYCWAMWKDEIGSAVNHYSAPHHYRTTSVCVSRLPERLQTLTRRESGWNPNLDSSVNKTIAHSFAYQFWCSWHHHSRLARLPLERVRH